MQYKCALVGIEKSLKQQLDHNDTQELPCKAETVKPRLF